MFIMKHIRLSKDRIKIGGVNSKAGQIMAVECVRNERDRRSCGVGQRSGVAKLTKTQKFDRVGVPQVKSEGCSELGEGVSVALFGG